MTTGEPLAREELDDRHLDAMRGILVEGFAQIEPGVPMALIMEDGDSSGESVITKRQLLPVAIASEEVVVDYLGQERDNERVTLKRVVDVVCETYEVDAEDIKSKSLRSNLLEPRHVAMYLSRELTDFSFPVIGRFLKRDHTSVMSAVDKIETRLGNPEEEDFRAFVDRLKLLIDPVETETQKRAIVLTRDGLFKCPILMVGNGSSMLGVSRPDGVNGNGNGGLNPVIDLRGSEIDREVYGAYANDAYRLVRNILHKQKNPQQ